MDRSEIEHAVALYLCLPFRNETTDRFLVDLLIALELFAYGDQIYNTENHHGLLSSPFSYLKINPLWHFIKSQLLNAVVLIGIAAFTIFAGVQKWIPDIWALIIAAIFVTIFLGVFIFGLICLPRFWINLNKAKQKTYDPLEAMLKIYPEMESSGPISARHIRDRAIKAADSNVVWPAPLFALLDDIISRTGRF